MRHYFPAILSLAEVLLRSPEPAICFFAASMYKNGFVAFDTYCQQVDHLSELVLTVFYSYTSRKCIVLDYHVPVLDHHEEQMNGVSSK